MLIITIPIFYRSRILNCFYIISLNYLIKTIGYLILLSTLNCKIVLAGNLKYFYISLFYKFLYLINRRI